MSLDRERIHKPIQKLRKLLKKAPKRPTSEQIHDLRTSSRRFEAEVDAFGLDSKANERGILRDLERVRKRAGKIRDIDVLTGYLLNLAVDGEQDCVVQLVEHLGVERARHAQKLRKLVLKFSPQLRRRLKRSSAKMERLVKKAEERPDKPASARSERATAKALQIAAELRSPARLNKTNLHPYRLKVKELRYVLQLSDQAGQQAFVDKLGEVKDAIGEWHDWGELASLATDLLDHGGECKLLPKLRGITEEKYENALTLANELRSKFLAAKPPKRRQGRTAEESELPVPVLRASAAIAGR